MCGICGIIEKDRDNRKLIREMCSLLQHRGPENEDYFVHENVSLGHRRLSIIDLNTGDQPIYNEKKDIVVIFNGELYNFKKFKSELISKGHRFSTESDTEILVHCYEEYGLSFIKELNGIFAFALYDIPRKRLVLARDHFGVKPLHYWHVQNRFIFASEQKAILVHPDVKRQINYNALHCQINLRYTQGDETLFKDIYRLPPAHVLVYENDSITLTPYYRLPLIQNSIISEPDIIDGIHFYLKQAIQRQMLSDVPIGVYLSGGMDSSAIVAMMHALNIKQINTFTMGFNEETDEFPDAEKIARRYNTNHQTTSLSLEPLRQFPAVIWHAEEPKINLLQGFNMSRFVSEGYKVVLGGLGGDELFLGYDIYKYINSVAFLLRYTHSSIQAFFEPLSRLLFSVQNATKSMRFDEYRRGLQMLFSIGNLEKYYLILRNCWDYDAPFYRDIYHPQFSVDSLQPVRTSFNSLFERVQSLAPLDAIAHVEFHSKMVNDYLLVDDRMSMAHSVELRVPFLDKELVEFLFAIPARRKMRKNVTKYLFRKSMQAILPPDIIQKKKWGFTVNPYLQFQKDLKSVAEKILTKKYVQDQGIFNYAYIRQILDYPPHPRLRWHYNFLWIVVGISIWEKMYIHSNKFMNRNVSLEEYYS